MKSFQLLLCSMSLFLTMACHDSSNTTNSNTTTITLQGKQIHDTVFLQFELPERTLIAQRNGKIEYVFKQNSFQKNTLLVQYDDYDDFVILSNLKEELKSRLSEHLKNFPEHLKLVKQKWISFTEQIHTTTTIPSFPEIQFKEELAYIETNREILDLYNEIVDREKALSSYFQLGPEAGLITHCFVEKNEFVTKDSKLLNYIPQQLKIKLSAEFELNPTILKQVESNLYLRMPIENLTSKTDNNGTTIFTGKLKQVTTKEHMPNHVIVSTPRFHYTIPEKWVIENSHILTIKGGKQLKLHVQKQTKGFVLYSSEKELILVAKN